MPLNIHPLLQVPYVVVNLSNIHSDLTQIHQGLHTIGYRLIRIKPTGKCNKSIQMRIQYYRTLLLGNEQNVSVMYMDISAILLCLDIIFQQDECFCSKLGLEVGYAKSNLA